MGGQAKVHQNRQFPRGCPPTLGQNRPLPRRRCPPTPAGASPECERLRAVSRADCRGRRPRPQRGRDLSGPRRRSRLHRPVRQRQALRREAPRDGTPTEARVVITTAPGEEGQVDYGDGPMVRWPATGKYRRTRLFVFTLACSRKAVRLLTWRSSAQIWCELHERAFRRLGGTTKIVVLDNLKEGVLTPDIYDPALNPLYRDMLAHYGVVALPCRVGDPDRKGQSRSRHRPHAEDAAARPALRDARGRAGLSRSLGRRTGPTRASTAPRSARSPSMFAEERPALGPLPDRAVSLLPLWRAHGPSRWLRRSRGGLLRRAARLDRPSRPRAVERRCTSG